MPLPDFEIFANRLRKMAKHHDKWARRKGITCYRIYDADVPEFPLAIDRYDSFLHVAEYRRQHGLSPDEYQLWRSGSKQVMQEVLELPADRIFFKEREQKKGKEQYEKRDDRQQEFTVTENGLKFIVNLRDYLDTGLFLDHRITRQMARDQADGKHTLNLFAYTGSFSVYMAAGGAASTTTIDLSNTYLEWARRNMALNGFEGDAHQYIRADVKGWLAEPVRQLYDLIILDPPTFSNSKAMEDILDVQRDHVELIQACLQRLTPGGILYFSTNFRKFKLDEAALSNLAEIRDLSAATIPQDFRNKKIHYCWEFKKPES
ncbi:class I SAM-dependent methyltransferase [Flavilitoribacter nigricans]|uniref:SAM-dependent methyltransferase n=1 Tax=Flavilitoribacter nigricans (strain ATCC 23147 / DSM 23189 / NBRC 102662 / NCIMB 1420 / SS-2) TaxID=1122177 RepID=A0A2D0MXK9_FLAN2|nr:class I SAM-dependent methyltransferase [Flavilitoribacter nigricans]PHN01011.1 SAM-dependent methyltransferase [Flavilitoribacter nigricans DSM 23189 = NBRC 102662]